MRCKVVKVNFSSGVKKAGKGRMKTRDFFAVESVKCGRGSEAAGGGML